ncbi:MAG: anti-sigma factor [Chitinophaga sp.]|uniref:anti-sigma factor n=1 Tax=Chitinophaga sp. TaxID=1869181 RepID=UPI001B07A584|nr:anti-sigma factor [Chitinophaga sp.]MBO9727656.1 anti-sigma factor [Chitinophaga sp.]
MLPETEQTEVEKLVSQYPDVKAALDLLQQDKERFVQLYAVAPPTGIKNRLTEIIRQENTEDGNKLLPEELRAPMNGAKHNGHQVPGKKKPDIEKETPIKYLATPKSSSDRLWKYLTAAIVVLLIGSVVMNFFFFQKSTDYKSRYKSLIATKEKLDAEKEHQALTSSKETTAIPVDPDPLSNPDFKWTQLQGGGAYAGKSVSVGWNAQTQAVYLQAKIMPLPPAGKQFQLWAIVNKKLVDAGVFDTGAELTQELQHMKAVAVAQGFAITLEKKGGSTEPSMNQVCMSAKVTK